MMSVYQILKDSLKGEGSEKMWKITQLLSDTIDSYIPEDKKEHLMTTIHYSINGGHFDKEFADKAISRFYYIDPQGVKHDAPYWSESEVKEIYDRIKGVIKSYNFYDFEVTLNMIKSDNCNKLKRWFPNDSPEQLKERLIEEAINYLDDNDNPFGTEKIWGYLNSK